MINKYQRIINIKDITEEYNKNNNISSYIDQEAQKLASDQKYLLATEKYSERLKIYVLAKNTQVEQLESKLNNQVQRQQQKIVLNTRKKPVLKFWKRDVWQQQMDLERKRLKALEERLRRIRKIKRQMNGERLQDMAEDRLRKREPELAQRRDDELKRDRQQQSLKQEQSKVTDASLKAGFGRIREITR